MFRSVGACSFLSAVAWIAAAGDLPPPHPVESVMGPEALEVEIRELDDTRRVLTDNRGGWRLERYFSNHEYLVEAEDEYGPLVQVVREVDGRPVGVQLARRYALEYFYSRPGGPCQRRILYEPRSGNVIAQVVENRPNEASSEPASFAPGPTLERDDVAAVTAGGRSYAFVSDSDGSSVIRSLEIDDPSTGTVLDRIDYTDSHLIVHLGSDVENRPRVFTIPRYVEESSLPTVVEISMRPGGKSDAVWSLAGRGKSPAVPKPNLRGALPTAVEDTLREGFPQALRRVREVSTCRELFEEFAVSGNQRLTTTLYVPPNRARTDDSCNRGALAFTHVGSSITHLCAGFGGLSLEQATIVLIHEALHYAGMEEAPFYEGALTSGEINQLVLERCGF